MRPGCWNTAVSLAVCVCALLASSCAAAAAAAGAAVAQHTAMLTCNLLQPALSGLSAPQLGEVILPGQQLCNYLWVTRGDCQVQIACWSVLYIKPQAMTFCSYLLGSGLLCSQSVLAALIAAQKAQ